MKLLTRVSELGPNGPLAVLIALSLNSGKIGKYRKRYFVLSFYASGGILCFLLCICLFVFSSDEHNMPMVIYCDDTPSVVV